MLVKPTLGPAFLGEGTLKRATKSLPHLYEERYRQYKEGVASQFYPHYSRPADFVSPARLHELYGCLSKDDLQTKKITVTIGGRILCLRELSSYLTFADLVHNGERAQLIINAQNFANKDIFESVIKPLQRGDIVGTLLSFLNLELFSRGKRSCLSHKKRRTQCCCKCYKCKDTLHKKHPG